MKFFSKKDSKKEQNTELNQNKKIIDATIVEENSTQHKSVPIAKIDPIKVIADKANVVIPQEETSAVINQEENKTEDVTTLKTKTTETPKPLTSEFEQKVDKIISSVAQLFAPFKELMLKIIPQSKRIIQSLDYFAIGIAYITKLVVLRYPLFIKFLKSFYFRIIIIFLVFMFVFGAIVSKVINSSYYINSIESAIHKSTGYQAKINGLIRVSFIPTFSISLSNVSFFTADNINSNVSQFKINQFDAANLKIDFKFFPLFVGHFSIKNIDIIGATLNLQTSDTTTIPSKDYTRIINNVEESIKSSISNDKIHEIEAKNTHIDKKMATSNTSNEVLSILDNLDSLIKSDNATNNPQEDTPQNKEKSTEDKSNKEDSQNSQDDNSKEGVTPLNSQEFNATSNTSLIAPKEDNSMNYSFFSKILSSVVNNISFSFHDVNNFSLRRSNVNIINNQGQKLVSVENIQSNVSSSFTGKINSKGSFRFFGSNIGYISKFNYEKDKVNFVADFILDSATSDSIKVKGYKNQQTGEIIADLSVENQGILLFINKFIFEINSKKIKNSSFNAKLLLNSNLLKIEDIDMTLNDNNYKGSFIWDFSNIGRNVIIDLTAKMADMSQITQGINSTLSTSVVKDSTFLAAIEEITNWKNSKINLFKPNHFMVNFKVENTLINKIVLDSLDIGFLFDNSGKVYIYNLSAKTKDYNAKATGRIDLDTKTALLSLKSKGSISVSGKTLGFSPKTIEFMQSIGKNKDNYDISTKLRLENNKLLFTDFIGYLGDRKLNDTYIIYTQRVEDSDILVSTKLPELNLEDISEIYDKQIADLTYEKVEDVNIFGLPENLKVKINMDVDKSQIKGIPFKNINLDISLFKTGFTVNKFSAIGEKGGSLTASLSADSIVLPVIAGHVNLENLVLRFENTRDLFFHDTNLVGNVVLNGKIKFNSDTLIQPFSNIDGNLNFIKQERIAVNRLANIDGLFLTLSKGKLNGKDTIYVNDIYGQANIKANIIELYPIAMLYIDNKKEYRGVSQIIIDLKDQKIQGEGSGEMTSDTRNKFKFTLSDNFLNPTIKTNYFKGEASSVGVKPVEKDITLINKKTHKVVDGLNDRKNKNNFNNTYNSNIANKSYDKLKDKLYDDILNENTN